MPPKARLHKAPETITSQKIEIKDTRTRFGDNRAAMEDTMMAAHAKSIRAAGLIDEEMEAQLSQPWHRQGELRMKYSKEYLTMHPEYVGLNADEMPTYETALRKRKERDAAQEKWLEDFQAGKIDEEGNQIRTRHTSSSSSSSEQSQPSSSSSARSTPSNHATSSQRAHPHQDPTINTTIITTNAKPERVPLPPPLTPLSGHPDYASIDYYGLAALCRDRALPGKGRAPILRNRLIQDDINVAWKLPREVRSHKSRRREYKHGSPDEGTIRGGSSGGENVELDLRNPLGGVKGKEGLGGLERTEESSSSGSESEEALEKIDGPNFVKRKRDNGDLEKELEELGGEGERKKTKVGE